MEFCSCRINICVLEIAIVDAASVFDYHELVNGLFVDWLRGMDDVDVTGPFGYMGCVFFLGADPRTFTELTFSLYRFDCCSMSFWPFTTADREFEKSTERGTSSFIFGQCCMVHGFDGKSFSNLPVLFAARRP
jgi:hypothetical protein